MPLLTDFSTDELRRYSRQIRLPEIGVAGQKKLKNARVLIVGLGGLGSPLAQYLAVAGIGTIGLIDDDYVDLSNLHRQVLFGTSALSKSKTESARNRLRDLNSEINVIAHSMRLISLNASDILANYDIVADASDNFATRYLVSEACVLAGIPDVFGSVHKFEGQVTILGTKGGPCYRCLYPVSPAQNTIPDCDETGVLGVMPGIIGTLQAAEVLKLVLGIGEPLIGRLLLVDLLSMKQREFNIQRNTNCPSCGDSPTISSLSDLEGVCSTKNEITISNMNQIPGKISVEEFASMRASETDHLLLDIREPFEFEIANIGGTLLPMGELPSRLNELPRDKEIVVLCHSGNRSARAAEFLKRAGFDNVLDLLGGIDAWSRRIDSKVPQY